MTAVANSLFDRIEWRDPLTGVPLEPTVYARTPAGVPICGALRVSGTNTGYPIVDCIARLTPELASAHREWLVLSGLTPVVNPKAGSLQAQATVDSFGFQWAWNSNPRTEEDLRHRVLEKFDTTPEDFSGRTVLDAGAGAGDQSRFILGCGASVLSVDLSGAIEVVSRKLRMNQNWFGVQGDIAHLAVADQQFDVVYCEGVIQHTADSFSTIAELKRVLKVGGRISAAHYVRRPAVSFLQKLRRILSSTYYEFVRRRLAAMPVPKLLLVSGNIAALSYVPVIGTLLRRSSLALYSSLMPDFWTTWTNTYDFWGSHSHQRFIAPDEFWRYFERAGDMEPLKLSPGVVAAKRIA